MQRRFSISLVILIVILNVTIVSYRFFTPDGSSSEAGKAAQELLTQLEGSYHEHSHQIGESPSTEPYLPRLIFQPEDVGVPLAYHEVIIVNMPMLGRRMGFGRQYVETLDSISTDTGVYSAEASVVTTAIVENKGLQDKSAINAFSADSFYKFSLGPGGEKIYSVRREEYEGSERKETSNIYFEVPDTILPDKPLAVGDRWNTVAKIPEDAPSIVKNERPSLDLKLMAHVVFDGEPALLYEGSEVSYVEFTGAQPVVVKFRGKRKFYISKATGRLLWGESYGIVEHPQGLKGTELIARKQLSEVQIGKTKPGSNET